LPVAAMFVNRSVQYEQSLERTFHWCFLPSFSSFGWEVSEEKIKMWKVNRRRTTDAKWWQKLTLPMWKRTDPLPFQYFYNVLMMHCSQYIWYMNVNTLFIRTCRGIRLVSLKENAMVLTS
jgi:hypothetical protein